MALYARIEKPLEVANRDELVNALKNMSIEFSDLYEEHKTLDRKYKIKMEATPIIENRFRLQLYSQDGNGADGCKAYTGEY